MLPQRVGPASAKGFSTTDDRVAADALAPGRIAGLRARLCPGALDSALIAGADPASSPRLAARATRLTSPRFRALIADGLERLLLAAHGRTRRWWAATRRDAVVANAGELRELVALLRGSSPLYARGIAILGELLGDGTGPAYHGDGEDLAHQLHEARAALAGGGAPAPAADTPAPKSSPASARRVGLAAKRVS